MDGYGRSITRPVPHHCHPYQTPFISTNTIHNHCPRHCHRLTPHALKTCYQNKFTKQNCFQINIIKYVFFVIKNSLSKLFEKVFQNKNENTLETEKYNKLKTQIYLGCCFLLI